MRSVIIANIFENNRQLGPIVVIFAAAVVIVLIIVYEIIKYRDKRREKLDDELDTSWRAGQVVNRVEGINRKGSKRKINQVKRESRDPKKKAENEANAKNTLLGGKSEAQMEAKDALDVFGPLGISSKKAKQIDNSKERVIINGYLQKSNTAPIRPVYSNTLFARQLQRKELESDVVGKEAETPALVMDSAAPSAVKITGAPVQKVKPTQLKRPTAAKAALDEEQPAGDKEEETDTTYISAIRPETGSEVSNAVVDFVATVQDEKPDIIKQGEEAIIPAAQETVKGFVPDDEVLQENAREEG